MPTDQMKLAKTLDSEVKRVSKTEGVTRRELIEELSAQTGYSTRHFYNFRDGKWPIPAPLIPVLCARFKSKALLEVLGEDVQTLAPEPVDFDKAAVEATKEVCDLNLRMMKGLREGSIDRKELALIEAAIEESVRRQRVLFALLERELAGNRVQGTGDRLQAGKKLA